MQLTVEKLRPQTAAVQLAQLAKKLPLTAVAGELAKVAVTGVCMDSRQIQPGDLYAACPGQNSHGIKFLAQARKAGAVAVLTDAAGLREVAATVADLPCLVVENVRGAAAFVAYELYQGGVNAAAVGGNAAPLLFGVTGTNGKTTTTYMLNQLLNRLGHKTGLIGTIAIKIGDTQVPSSLTTPEATQNHALLAAMRQQQVTAVSMEVSSHALDFGRTDYLRYTVAGFTNLTQDHLDQHGQMANYFASKMQLFCKEKTAAAVVVVTDEWGLRAYRHAVSQALPVFALASDAYAAKIAPAHLWVLENVNPIGTGYSFCVRNSAGDTLAAQTALPGEFNVYNAALAILMLHAAGFVLAEIAQVLADPPALSPEVPGRMQVVGVKPLAIVDFAHNPDALEKVLTSVRRKDGRTLVVFGATGKREKQKRPLMGQIAVTNADVVIVTDDEPHGEPAAPLRRDVLAGAYAAAQAKSTAVILEVSPRERAIATAVALANSEDVIVIAGRGHETTQEFAGSSSLHQLDDREALRAALAARG